MSEVDSPALLLFTGDFESYIDDVYGAFLDSFVNSEVQFRGLRVSAQYRPAAKGKHFAFWHVVSEAPDRSNRNEDDRIPNLERCARIRWISWAIANAGQPGFDCWDQTDRSEKTAVIWAREFDFVVVLAKRSDYYLLKTAFCNIKSGQRRKYESELAAWNRLQNG